MAIKEEFVEIKWSNTTADHYILLGYKPLKPGMHFIIPINHLQEKSSKLITSICDKCGIEKSVIRRRYRDLCNSCEHPNPTKKNYLEPKYNLIKEKSVTIKWSGKNKKFYEPLGYVWTGFNTEFEVKIEHLNKFSPALVTMTCEQCLNERVLKFKNYNHICLSCTIGNSNRKKYENEEFKNKKAEHMRSINIGKFGPLNRNWNHSLSELERRKRKSGDTKTWSKKIRNIFNNKCFLCDSMEKLNAHHLMNYKDYPELRYDINNGVCLCQKCHKEFHSMYGIRNNTKDQFEEFCRIIDLSEWVK